MIELADIATLAFIASGLTYQSVKYWRSDRRIKMKRERPVSLVLRGTDVPEDCRTAVILVFDRRGCLMRKFPDATCRKRKKSYRIECSTQEGVLDFCVLFTSRSLNLSAIHHRSDVDRQFGKSPHTFIAETGWQEVSAATTLELHPVETDTPGTATADAAPAALSMLLPPEVVTDAMAKELAIDLTGCSEPWETGYVHYTEGEPDNWLSMRREADKLVLQPRTNFSPAERNATVEIRTDDRIHTLKVRQQIIGIHSALTVSRRLYVTAGLKNEAVSIAVTPDDEHTCWRIKSANANDGGCWFTVYPPVGVQQKGCKTLQIHLEAKPANIRSRSLSLTLETGTYPFSHSTDVLLMQGVCFDYYIEYPRTDICARHNDVIETPLTAGTGGGAAAASPGTYTVCVDSNQPWRIIRNEQADWVRVSAPELMPGHYSGRFTVQVDSNAGYRVRGGFPAARHTVLSLVNDTGIVRDILIYQGGYVRIHGKCWLDRNLAGYGKPAQVAIPLGLEKGSTLNHGTYFQFGSQTDEWKSTYKPYKDNWYADKAENPTALPQTDPSPAGWRVPSHIEMEAFINSPAAPMELQREEDRTNICILSDDGVPVYLPLCGHRSHINGCKIMIPHGHRYWTGSSQSPVYGYSLCVEPSRQMYVMHDMKKYGFPVRCVLDG